MDTAMGEDADAMDASTAEVVAAEVVVAVEAKEEDVAVGTIITDHTERR